MNADPRAPEYREAERKTAHQPVTPTPQARAGVTGHNVRYVLVFGYRVDAQTPHEATK
jgi:hypothetical protein